MNILTLAGFVVMGLSLTLHRMAAAGRPLSIGLMCAGTALLAPEMISTPGQRVLRRRHQRRALPAWFGCGRPLPLFETIPAPLFPARLNRWPALAGAGDAGPSCVITTFPEWPRPSKCSIGLWFRATSALGYLVGRVMSPENGAEVTAAWLTWHSANRPGARRAIWRSPSQGLRTTRQAHRR
jgi:hypothetical protein